MAFVVSSSWTGWDQKTPQLQKIADVVLIKSSHSEASWCKGIEGLRTCICAKSPLPMRLQVGSATI